MTRSGWRAFWADLLDWHLAEDSDGATALLASDDTGFRIRFVPSQDPKVSQNQMHFDLTSTSIEDQRRTVAKALGLGAPAPRHRATARRRSRGARRPGRE
jgi:Glyoxalase-like domain